MNRGVWEGKYIPENNRILIMGESHYDSATDAKIGDRVRFETADVVREYLNRKKWKDWFPFFDRIRECFGYGTDEAEIFYNQIWFGNYVDVICGKQDGNASNFISINRDTYNTDLFQFVNEKKVDILVCFSITAYNNLPSFARDEETEMIIDLGLLGDRKNIARLCNYMPDTIHDHCRVSLLKKLTVYGIRHPSAPGGFRSDQVHRYFMSQGRLSHICKGYLK